DDAHAAPGNLLQQLIVAEKANSASQLRRDPLAGREGRSNLRGSGLDRCPRCDWGYRLGQPAQTVLVREERAQLGGQVGMPAEQLFSVWDLAGAFAFQIGGKDLVHALFKGSSLVGCFGHASRSLRQELLCQGPVLLRLRGLWAVLCKER